MTTVTTALLCEHAQKRENVLFISAGGISMIESREFPMKLGLFFVFGYLLESLTEVMTLDLALVISHTETGTRVARAELQITGGPVDNSPVGGPVSDYQIVPLHEVPIPAPGEYQVEILANDEPLLALPFSAFLVVDDHEVQNEELQA